MKYQLLFNEPTSIERVIKQVENGARFVLYYYWLSLLVVTLTRLSPAIWILSDESHKRYRNKYNLLTAIFGWWTIPCGPLGTAESIRSNNKGGFDVSEDIILNINELHLESGKIDLIEANLIFTKPDNWDLKAYEKAFSSDIGRDLLVSKIVAGVFLNTGNQDTKRTIGIEVKKDFDGYVENMKAVLWKAFGKGAPFMFIDLSEKTEMSDLLQKRGKTLVNRSPGK